MALFHQIRQNDQLDKIRRDQERAFAERTNVDVDGQALSVKRGRKPDPNSKKMLTLRLDPEVIERFKESGDGWQSRINAALRKSVGLD